jgi:hypothetical protein
MEPPSLCPGRRCVSPVTAWTRDVAGAHCDGSTLLKDLDERIVMSVATERTMHSGPPGYPFLGHVPEFLRDKLGFLSMCAARYGDVVKLHIGEPTFLLSLHAEVEANVLRELREVLDGHPPCGGRRRQVCAGTQDDPAPQERPPRASEETVMAWRDERKA